MQAQSNSHVCPSHCQQGPLQQVKRLF